jgi:biotin operon repressor
MKVVFVKEKNTTWIKACKLSRQSSDACFSPNEIARLLGISPSEAQANVDRLEERGLCVRIDDDLTQPRSGDERWILKEIPLTVGREYEVLTIEADHYRILSDPEAEPSGNDPIIFHQSLFKISSPAEPTFWIGETDEYGDRFYHPSAWDVDFFIEYHDGVEAVCRRFWEDLKKYYPETWKERTQSEKEKGAVAFKCTVIPKKKARFIFRENPGDTFQKSKKSEVSGR